jgi:hypothetical protein
MTKVDERLFKMVKLMCKSGAPYAEIAEYFQISPTTVKRINNSESIVEYRNIMAAWAISQRERREKIRNAKQAPVQEPVPEPVQIQVAVPVPEEPVIPDLKMPGGTMSAAYQFNRMIEMMKKQNEILTLMSNKLTYLVEQLT